MSRREALKLLGLVSGGASLTILAACAPPPPPSPAPAKPAEAPAQAAPGATAAPAVKPAESKPAEKKPAEQPKQGGTLVAGWEADVSSLANNFSIGVNSLRVTMMMFEQLVNVNYESDAATPPFVPGLATAWEKSPDGTSYTFKLRQGVKFHDGTPFDAEAVKFNFERNFKQDHESYDNLRASGAAIVFAIFKQVDVVDPMTVRVTINEPNSNFMSLISFPYASMHSPTNIKKVGNEKMGDMPVGTGPFKFVERRVGDRVVVERNPEYWGGAPNLDKIIVRMIPEHTARITALTTGEVDWVSVVPPDFIDQVKSRGDLEVVNRPIPHIWLGIFNHREKPFNDLRVRQAVNLAVNREAMAKDLLKDSAIPARQAMGPGNPIHDPSIKGYGYEPAKARQLLADAGYPNGFETSWWVPNSGSGMMIPVPMAEFIQRNWKEIGIDMKLITSEWATHLGNFLKGAPPGVGGIWQSFLTEGEYRIENFFSTPFQPPKGFNAGWYSNQQFDELVKAGRTAPSDEAKLKSYREAQQIALDEAAWVYVVHDTYPKAYNKKVRGFVNAASWFVSFKGVWMA